MAHGGTDAFGAVVSLYIPDASDTPYTADPIGTDKSGHTTWRLGVGASSGTLTATQTISSFTMVAGATDLHVFAAGEGGTSGRVDCAMATHTASGGVVSASCAARLADETSAFNIEEADVSITPVPVQVSDNFKASSAGSLRMSLGGVGVSALAILGTAGMMLVRM
ncbi:hypothetical protein GSI_11808 [Ganoderma sinense ZZ0214-1]|uniref:Uncharacterized protein n=1 Tax=Ganoderma sinense ZZ0214-1 TaxID=1077348 RepID=A0A2G8RX40_9APHY|nr:hypothetical protein GSI_11808 [Ganoderma sinense ZZ0214-1]